MIRFFTATIRRILSSITLVAFLVQLFMPTVTYALTSGPAQPEFSSFEPVATTDMVNPLTGDFNYNLPILNVPGPNGGGYALSLSYHSGVSVEEDASWVGYGWTLNPGAINRGKKGFPDDYKKASIKEINKTKTSYTASVGHEASLDLFTILAPSVSRSIRYNNYKGYSTQGRVGISAANGLVSVGFSKASDGTGSFDFDINPAALIKHKSSLTAGKALRIANKNYKAALKSNDKGTINGAIASGAAAKNDLNKSRSKSIASTVLGSVFSGIALGENRYAPTVSSFKGVSVSVRGNFGGTPSPAEIAFRGGFMGSVSIHNPHNESTKEAHGFMHQDTPSDESYMDYSVEKEAIFTKRDKYLSIPFQSPDNFALSGEGLRGTFKFKKNKLQIFGPPKVVSRTVHTNAYFMTQAGLNVGVGAGLGGGAQDLEVNDISANVEFNNTSGSEGDEGVYFRFDGDKANDVRYTDDDKVSAPTFVTANDSRLNMSQKAQFATDNPHQRAKRSSYIGYHTNEIVKHKNFLAYQKRQDIEDLVQREGNGFKDLIGEICTYNEEGSRYIYGIPVYTKDEKTRSHGVREGGGDCSVPISNVIHYDIDDRLDEVGKDMFAPYANTYLLTEITNTDYIDRTFNGPSEDDFGGWTKFSYTKEYGYNNTHNDNKWYKWRMPYNGLNYSKNAHSDVRDDMGTYVSGQKEIYYLDAVETKTHIAKFILNDPANSLETRNDGLAAEPDDKLAASDPTAKDVSSKQRYLKKIELYSKDPNDPTKTVGKPIKTIHFEYYDDAHSLCKGIPSAVVNGGKLTLKRVWFEYEGIVKSKISPYEFLYEYKKDHAKVVMNDPSVIWNPISHFQLNGPVVTHYQNITDELSVDVNENPNYDANNTDAWGNLAYNGIARAGKLQNWVYQGARSAADRFDPAAWNLKTIVLPSGGQILIQYEEHDYQHVQNLVATTLVSLETANDNHYTLKMSDLGITTAVEAAAYKAQLDQYFHTLKNDQNRYLESSKIYFKMLYSLLEGNISQNEINVADCSSEYITGYCNVSQIEYDNNLNIKLTLVNQVNDKQLSPVTACRDYYLANMAGLKVNKECKNPDAIEEGTMVGSSLTLLKDLSVGVFRDFKADANRRCMSLNPAYSYLKLPMPKFRAKKGGGIRVKRIMMYDAGLVADDETLYGTEYLYKLEDGSSSGVATNEAFREENALIYCIEKREPQKRLQKLVTGDDKDQFEGPLGESLLPFASISYSRVVTQSIYEGPSSPGFTVNEYHTTKDYPSVKLMPVSEMETKRRLVYLPAILWNTDIDNRYRVQGFSFVMNDMNGKPKSVSRYGGGYPKSAEFKKENFVLAFKEEYEYFKPEEKVPVLTNNGTIAHQNLGREEEITIEAKKVEDVIDKVDFTFNSSIGFLMVALWPQFYMTGSYTNVQRKLKTVVTSKVVFYPSYLKSVKTTKDGISYTMENKVFDSMTGEVLVSTTTDEYYNQNINNEVRDYVYTSYSIPSRCKYPAFNGKYINENYETNIVTQPLQLSALHYKFSVAPASTKFFIQGDLLCLYNSGSHAYAYVDKVNLDNSIEVKTVTALAQNLEKVRIINSGYNNMLKVGVGEITSYGQLSTLELNPLSPNLKNVISATATVFDNTWTMNDYMSQAYGIDKTQVNTYNPYLSGERGKYRMHSQYAYKAQNLSDYATTSLNKTFTSGLYTYQGFNYQNLSANVNWILGNKVKYYSPHGEPLEEENAVGIPSTAKFGHHENVPLMIASNARYANVFFAGFEDWNGTDIVQDKAVSHTGNNCLRVAASSESQVVGSFQTDNGSLPAVNKYILRWWAKTPNSIDNWAVSINHASTPVTGSKIVLGSGIRTGEWSLYEAQIELPLSLAGQNLSVSLKNNAQVVAYIDDVKLQPQESQASCYVYDNTNLRLLAVFDDRHFAMLYQYDAEGKLVRKLIETERGVKTITESQYNTPTQSH